MGQDQALDVLKETLLVSLKLAGPLLIISIVVGLVVAIFQAATQINEQTLTFVPKVFLIALLLLVLGSYMISTMNEFINYIFSIMINL